MPDENQQQNTEPGSIPVSPQESIPDAPIPTSDSVSVEMPPQPPESHPEAESAIPVNNDISANEPLETFTEPNIPNEPNNPNITIEKHGNDVTITEVMEPTAHSEPATAQMAGNEPFDKTPDSAKAMPGEQDKPIDLAEEIKVKQRQENLKLANETRQEKKRKKIDAILDLFAKQTNLTNDEVEKLLHVSDATATRYLETLEKEGKIKQVGKTGKGVTYQKI